MPEAKPSFSNLINLMVYKIKLLPRDTNTLMKYKPKFKIIKQSNLCKILDLILSFF